MHKMDLKVQNIRYIHFFQLRGAGFPFDDSAKGINSIINDE